MKGYYLVKVENFKLPKKIYGDTSIVNRWIKSFESNSEKNMGIILSGIKGSGKTITAQKFCIDINKPVIIIAESFSGTEFIDFMTSPALGSCVIFIDEFEKVYSNYTEQQDFIMLMDGNFQTNNIFLLTVNSFSVNEYLVNRLNRVKYRKHYDQLDEAIVDEVIDDLLINKSHKESVKVFFEKIGMQTFDLLVNVIKEMNLFNEDALTCGKHLNLTSENKYYSVFEIINGIEVPCENESFSFNDEEVCFTRKTLSRGANEEEHESWEADLKLTECEVTKVGFSSFKIHDPKQGLTFLVKEAKRKYMVF